ncbi:MAG: hypothetical protein WCI74_03475 [Actinomycetes bacterium]
MNKRPLWALLVVAVAVIVLLILVIPDGSPTSAPNPPETGGTPTTSGSASPTQRPTDSSGVTVPATEQPSIDLPNLEAGVNPPQFVVVSFDGGAEMKTGIMKHYLDLAKDTDSRFSFFVSGVYLLPDNAMRLNYNPPNKPRGTSAIGFADPDMVGVRIERLSQAWDMGMEIGTHYNGHFCGPGGVGTWRTADWTSEIKQWNNFLDNWRTYNPQAADKGPLPFSSAVVKGGRTPCLEGQQAAMFPAFKDAGYLYDTSGVGTLKWPTKNKYGLWDIPLQAIKISGASTQVLSMDYNFLANLNGAKTTAPADKCKQIEDATYKAYTDALNAVNGGNRAPLILGNHMNDWVCGAFTNALTKFVRDAHNDHPDVKFISTLDLVHWMDAQDPALLKAWQAKATQVE